MFESVDEDDNAELDQVEFNRLINESRRSSFLRTLAITGGPWLTPGKGNPPEYVQAVMCRAMCSVLAMTLFSCAGKRPSDIGVTNGHLAPCPSSPNCVSSDARDAVHAVDPLRIRVPQEDAWRAARRAVLALPRTRIVFETPTTLHAESRSAVFGFVDDVQLELRPEAGTIAVRSASRVGYGDMGVNRRRVEALRTALRRENVVD